MSFQKKPVPNRWFGARKKALLLLVLVGVAGAQIHAAQSEGNGDEPVPRTLEVLDVGYQLPIQIVAVRNLQKRQHWIRDLELEIRNVSSKPIYEIYFTLYAPDDKGPGRHPVAVSLEYGRSDLLHPREHALPDDKPLGSGESVVLKVKEPLWKGYETHLRVDDVEEQATFNMRMMVVAINFGDGTGFVNGGVPYPRDSPMGSRPQHYVRIRVDPK